ncbi:uncharacterized protein LOC117194683 [Drosophila miranda]|uniref:uncharacterized protein LOC117190124 n=1 Tax=Drosophila miranda TaxID=7229 RepID=UPI00143F9398|nr:uncharacterized protein LOC117190124 [Drosophila miranda]XP_033255085.1 uncharacterized protein LOC117194683 [Drosophila miranda]
MTKCTGNLHKRLNPSAAASSSGYRTPNAKRSLMSSLNSIRPSPSTAQWLANSQLKASKSPLKRVRVLDYTLRPQTQHWHTLEQEATHKISGAGYKIAQRFRVYDR